MKTLLLNKNPIISKLVRMSAQKLGYEFDERSNDKDIDGYDIIIVDDGVDADLDTLKGKCKILVCISTAASASLADRQVLHKPFLPTDLIALIKSDAVVADDAESKDSKDEGSTGDSENASSENEGENAAEEDEIDLDSLSFDNKLLEPEAPADNSIYLQDLENAENSAAGGENSDSAGKNLGENLGAAGENLSENSNSSENSVENSDAASENGENLAENSENSGEASENSAEGEKDELAITPVDFDTKLDFDFNSLAPSGDTALNSDIADEILSNIESDSENKTAENAENSSGDESVSSPVNDESAASESVLGGENSADESVESKISLGEADEVSVGEKNSLGEAENISGESQIKLDGDEPTIGNESQITLDKDQEVAIGNESQITLDDETAVPSSNKSGENADEAGEQALNEQESAPEKGTLSAEELAKATFLQPLSEPVNDESIENSSIDENQTAETIEIQNENENSQAENAEIQQNLASQEAESAEIQAENAAQENESAEIQGENAENAAFSVEEKEEGKMSFDDLPQDASFLGQKNSENIDPADIKPVLVDEKPAPQSTQELVKEQLADLNAMDDEIKQNEPSAEIVANAENLSDISAENSSVDEIQTPQTAEIQAENSSIDEMQEIESPEIQAENEISEENSASAQSVEKGDTAQSENLSPSSTEQSENSAQATNGDILSDLQGLSEKEIQAALGETPSSQADLAEPSEISQASNAQENGKELMNEISKGVSGAITSSISSDNALKNALKGMKMHIDINIKFDEEKL